MSERIITLEVLCLMHGWRPSDLAAALHVSRSQVSLWFHGTRGLTSSRVQEIATLLDEEASEVRKAYNLNALPQYQLTSQDFEAMNTARLEHTKIAVV